MIRHLAAIALVLCLSPVPLYAQSTHITVTSSIANVHKSPSTGAAVLAKAPIGTSYEITRELGSWVKISWPASEDGSGYLHVSWGRIADGLAPAPSQTVGPRTTSIASTSGRPAPASTPRSTVAAQGEGPAGVQQSVASTAQSINSIASSTPGTPTEHLIGIGARMGSTMGYGVSGRAAITDHFGVQLEISRYAPSTIIAPERMTSVQFAPSVMYSLPDKLTDYIWVRPYLGAGLTMYRHTLNSGIPGDLALKDNGIGKQLFGGTALAFASAPRFTLSVDYGYRWSQVPLAPFAGTELAGKGVSVSGHWYVK